MVASRAQTEKVNGGVKWQGKLWATCLLFFVVEDLLFNYDSCDQGDFGKKVSNCLKCSMCKNDSIVVIICF